MAVVTQTMQDNVTELYLGFFGRAPDAAGFGYWTNRLAVGDVTIQQISKAFAATPEFISNYDGLTPAQQVTRVYSNVLGRTPDAGGLAYWVGQLTSGTQSIADVVWNVTNSAFLQTGTADGLLVQNKVAVGEYFALTLASNDTAQAATAYNQVTSLTSSILVAESNLYGSTFTLTTGPNTVTSANTLVNGYIDVQTAANTTVSALDVITPTGVKNGLNVTLGGAAAAAGNQDVLNGARVSNVQTVNIRNATTGANAIVATMENTGGVTAINSYLSAGAVTLGGTTALANTVNVGIIGNGSVASGAFTATYAAAATTPVLNISGGVNTAAAVTVVAAGSTLGTITSTGAANAIGNLTFANTAAATSVVAISAQTNLTTGTVTTTAGTVNITGPATLVTLGAITDANLTTINASGMTAGGVKLTLIAPVTSFTGGAGVDTISTVAGLGATAAINGGAGADILNVVAGDATSLSTAALGGRFTNFENLRNSSAAAVNASFVSGITTVTTAAAGGGFTGLTAAQAAAVAITANMGATATTYALASAVGTTDVLGLNFTNATSTTQEGAQALTVTGFETLNLNIGSGALTVATIGAGAAGSNYAFAGAANLTTLNVTGSFAGALDISANATAVTALNASANTAAVSVTTGGQTGALVVTGTSGNDTFTLGAMGAGGTQSIIAGAGTDTVNGTQAVIAAATINGGLGADTLVITDAGAVTVNDATFSNVSNIETVSLPNVTALTWNLGGFANALATQNAGVLNITAAGLLDTVASTINASGLSAGNSIALTATLAHGVGPTAFAVTGSAGADSVTVSSGAGTTSTVTITETTGTTSKTVNLSGLAASGAVTVSTGAGADTITGGASAGATSITAGGAADTVNLHAAGHGVTTLTYANGDSTAAAFDLVSGYTLTADIIDFVANAVLQGAGAYNATQTGVANLTATVANGVITFGGTAATGLSLANALTAAQNLTQITATAGTTAAFNLNGNAYVVEYNATSPVVIDLVGTVATSLGLNANNIIVS